MPPRRSLTLPVHLFRCVACAPLLLACLLRSFVCTTCSGIHREMQHKIKSVGMSTFTVDEIKAIDKSGNSAAQATWMAKYSASDTAIPPESDVEKIRQFIKQKYQQKRWFSETPNPAAAGATANTPAVQPVSAVLGDNPIGVPDTSSLQGGQR